jgi:hypothetical protein
MPHIQAVSKPGVLSQRIGEVIAPALGLVPGLVEQAHQGPRQKAQGAQIVIALVALTMGLEGGLSQFMMRLFNMSISDAALSQRRARMGVAVFEQVAAHALRPLADLALHPGCFLHGWRLVGIDGTQYNLSNTPQNNRAVPKAGTRRGKAAFAKMLLSALVELGTHAPLAASLGFARQGELGISLPLLERLPEGSLLVLDRLYGNAPMLAELQRACPQRQSHFLVRVRDKLAVKTTQRHADGSAQVQVSLRDKQRSRKVLDLISTREVRGRVWSRQEKKWADVRLWTSLSPAQAGAEELLAAYGRRWEQELCYRELKMDLRGSALLQSHTPTTAAQEVLAMLIGCSILAAERLAAAARSEDEQVRSAGALRISFAKCRVHVLGLWITLEAGAHLLSAQQQTGLIEAVYRQIASEALPKRRPRSCQRKVRQPVTKWPRMITPTSVTSPLKSKVIKIT